MLAGVRAAMRTFLMWGHQVVRHGDIDRGIEFDAFDGADRGGLDLDRFVEMRLERLPHQSIEPDDAAVEIVRLRRFEPHQDAAATLGRNPHDGVGADAQLLHQGAIEADHQPRAVAELIGEMIHAGHGRERVPP